LGRECHFLYVRSTAHGTQRLRSPTCTFVREYHFLLHAPAASQPCMEGRECLVQHTCWVGNVFFTPQSG
jgi:hypothetical protein